MKIKNKIFAKISSPKAIILIVILTSLVYANSLKNSFVRDDHIVIVNNDFVKSWKNFPLIFTKDYLTSISEIKHFGTRDIGSGETTYRPVVTISYFIDYSLWKLNPFGYHLTNLLLHIFNAILLYVFINLIAKNKKIALLTSLLFTLHPANSEAVNGIAFREDLLAFLFFISSFILFIKLTDYAGRKKVLCYIGSLVLFLLALFSKEMALVLPILFILYDYSFSFGEKTKNTFRSFRFGYAGYFFAALLYLWIWKLIKGDIGEFFIAYPYPGGNFYTNLLTMSGVFVTYIQWLFLPINVHPAVSDDPSFIFSSFFNPRALLCVGVIIFSLALAIKMHRSSKKVSFSILWFFVTLLPVSNIFPISNLMASRYLYIPSVGFCFLIAYLLFKLSKLKVLFASLGALRKAAKNIAIVLLGVYSIFTITHNSIWRDNTVLWSTIVEFYPSNAFARTSLGESFKKKGLLKEAAKEYRIAISLNPHYSPAHRALGIYYYEKGMLEESIKEFEKTIELNPNSPSAHTNLGASLGNKGLYPKAIGCFKKAINIDSGYTSAYNNLGVTYARMKKWSDAKNAWEKVLKIKPHDKNAQDSLEKLKRLGYYNE
ncbi:MAG: tetratricopeptide repeat protein [Candidatus Omnitrophica bacterium]|nr:tetratricopeptide repeat protein [Candidatus Omnitrophota bacterium]